MMKSDKMGCEGAWFAARWMLDLNIFSIRLHRWWGSDDPDALHDHSSAFITLVLWGGYDDKAMVQGEMKIDRLRIGSVRFRQAEHRHTVINRFPATWTLCLFFRPKRRWQFFSLKNGKRMMRDKYFAEIGHHTTNGERIRIRPDGKVIQ